MKIKNQYIMRVVIFSLVLLLLSSFISKVLHPKWKGNHNNYARIATFYKQPRNSIDVLVIGASSIRSGIWPLTMWEEYGFTTYTRASGNQLPLVSYYYLLEALKYQHPEVVVIDGIGLAKTRDLDESEGLVRIGVDPMKLSIEKIQLAFEIDSISATQSFYSYIFPIFRYHDLWKEVGQDDFNFDYYDKYDPFKGATYTKRNVPFSYPDNYMYQTEDVEESDPTGLFYYEKIIRLCSENNIDLIFITTPRLSWNYQQHNGVKELADKYGLTYIDYSLPKYLEIIDLDPSTDFYDRLHINIFGSIKVSNHLGAYLHEHYDFTDKRGDPQYSQWNIDLQYFKTWHDEQSKAINNSDN